jgi:hypothetical protein
LARTWAEKGPEVAAERAVRLWGEVAQDVPVVKAWVASWAERIGLLDLTFREAVKAEKLLGMGLSAEEVRTRILEDRVRIEKEARLAEARERARARLYERVQAGKLSFWAAYELAQRLFRDVPEAVTVFGNPEEEEGAQAPYEALRRLANPWTYLPQELREEVEGWARAKARELHAQIKELPWSAELDASHSWDAEFRDGSGRTHAVQIEAWVRSKWVESWDRDVDEYAPGPHRAGAKTDPGIRMIPATSAGYRIRVDGQVALARGLVTTDFGGALVGADPVSVLGPLYRREQEAYLEWQRLLEEPGRVKEELRGQVKFLLRCPICGAEEERDTPKLFFDRKVEEGEHVGDARPWPCLRCSTGELSILVERRGPSEEEIRAAVEEARKRLAEAEARYRAATEAFERTAQRLLAEMRNEVVEFLTKHGLVRRKGDQVLAEDWGYWVPVDDGELVRLLRLAIQREVVR